MIPKPTLLAAVRACPVNGVAGHAPQIFHHALLAYLKTAATGPAKKGFLAAYMAEILLSPSPFVSWLAVYRLCFHSQISMMMFWGSGISPNIFLKHYTIQDKKLSMPAFEWIKWSRPRQSQVARKHKNPPSPLL